MEENKYIYMGTLLKCLQDEYIMGEGVYKNNGMSGAAARTGVEMKYIK